MKRNEKYLLIGGAVALLLLIPKMSRAAWYTVTDWLIPEFESFSAHPYWDVSRYSWGYGTPAPGATGTISKEQALQEMRAHLNSDYNYLSQLITRPLSANQWAALLSFSYNLGTGNADNLINNINSGNDVALYHQWQQYVNVDGVASQNLIHRRAVEWQVWTGDIV